MDNIKLIEVENPIQGIVETFVVIDRGNGEFTSMLKSTYDEQLAAQAMPQLIPEVVEIIPEEVQIIPEEVQADPVIPEA
jgi:hypothetical protein